MLTASLKNALILIKSYGVINDYSHVLYVLEQNQKSNNHAEGQAGREKFRNRLTEHRLLTLNTSGLGAIKMEPGTSGGKTEVRTEAKQETSGGRPGVETDGQCRRTIRRQDTRALDELWMMGRRTTQRLEVRKVSRQLMIWT